MLPSYAGFTGSGGVLVFRWEGREVGECRSAWRVPCVAWRGSGLVCCIGIRVYVEGRGLG